MPSLLVFTPTYRNLLRPETVESVKAQQFDGELEHVISDHNPHQGDRSMENVLAQYQRARDLTLAGKYDGLLTVEHDMRLPSHAAQALWDTDAAVVYGVYILRHGANVLSAWRHEGDKAMGMSLSLYPQELKAAKKQRIVRVSGVGFGCTLIRRNTLEAIPFRGAENSGPDVPFAVDCLHAGMIAKARMDVECDHYHEGKWLTVKNEGNPVARFLPAVDITANVDGQSVRLNRNTYYSLPVSVAFDLQRAGYGQITNGAERETATAEERETAELPAAKRRSKRAG